MDLIAHGIWTGFLVKILNLKIKNKIKIWSMVFWGVFPDIFSFAIITIWAIIGSFAGNFDFSQFRSPSEIEPAPVDSLPIMRLTHFLYNISHSALIFLLIFGLTYFIYKQPIWSLTGWFAHILIDIPTHSYRFFPTPFLWPLSDFRLNGLSWATPGFLIVNYFLILVFFLLLRYKKII